MMDRKALIITDGTESILPIASLISDVLSGFQVKICCGEKFCGTDLLPAEIFFLGCEKANPASFTYIKEMLSHINLASRKCGIFSTNKAALDYLAKIVKDCEADLGAPLQVVSEIIPKPKLQKWVESIVK